MNTKLPQRRLFFHSLISFPLKVIGFIFQSIFILLLAGILLLLLSGIYLGVYVNHHLDDPMTYTPYPLHSQPPDGLTFRQFFVGVDGYYDNLLYNDSEEITRNFHNIPRNILKEHAFAIKQLLMAPLIFGAITTDSLATINPKGWIAQTIRPKDFHQHVEPLAGKYDGIADLPEVLILQIQANYWYFFGDEFMDFYHNFGLVIQ